MGEATEAVQVLMAEYGISERTAWRWLKRFREEQRLPAQELRCEFCGEPIEDARNRRRRFCDSNCRVKNHYRLRGRKNARRRS